MIEQLRQVLPQTVVEIGGGLRTVLDILRAFAPLATYHSFEFSEVANEQNRERFPWANWWEQDILMGIGLPDDDADFIFSSHVMEHMEDPWQFIQEQLRVLRPGGVLAVAIPLHAYHREHRQIFSLDYLVSILKEFSSPVTVYGDGRLSEAVGVITKGLQVVEVKA